jgi:hypothetical protein
MSGDHKSMGDDYTKGYPSMIYVEDFRITPATENAFGEVASGYLTVRGRMQNLVIVRRPSSISRSSFNVRLCEDTVEDIGYCALDQYRYPQHGGYELSVACLLVQKRTLDLEDWTGLALQLSDGDEEPSMYRRIGIIHKHYSLNAG